jgi:phage-related protein
MAEETWKVILEEGTAGTGSTTGSAGGTSGGKSPVTQSKTWGDIGKIAGAVAGFASAIGFIIQALRRSKILSTFTDNLLTIMGAVVDMLLIPLIPVLVPFLQLAVKLLPIAKKIGEMVAPVLEQLVKAIGVLLDTGDLGPIVQWFDDLFNKYLIPWIRDFFTNVMPKVMEFLKAVIPKVVSFLSEIIPVIIKTLTELWPMIVGALVGLWNLIAPYVNDFLINIVLPTIKTLIDSILSYTIEFIKNMADWLPKVIGVAINNNLPDVLKIPGFWKSQEMPDFQMPTFKIDLQINGQKVKSTTSTSGGTSLSWEDSFFSSALG